MLAYTLMVVLASVVVQSALTIYHVDPRVTANVYFTETYQGKSEMLASGNLITTIGENQSLYAHISNLMNLTAISVGNSTPGAALTQLNSEAAENGFARQTVAQSAVWQNGGHDAINFTSTFTAVTAMETLNSAGLQWSDVSGSDNNLFAVAYLTDGTAQQFPVGSTCTVTWVLTFNEHP